MERSDRLTTSNVSHGSRAIHGVAKNYAEFIGEHLENRWKPSEEQLESLESAINGTYIQETLYSLYQDLKKLKG